MPKSLIIAGETCLQLRRDKIFAPVLIAALVTGALAALISGFSIEEITKIYLDLGLGLFHMTGITIAIMWGAKLYSNSSSEFCAGHETLLSGLVSRQQWLTGRFIGLSSTLIIIGLILTTSWFTIGVLFRTINWQKELLLFLPFLGYLLEWIVMAAMTMLIAASSGQAVTFFTSFTLWALGQFAKPIYEILTPQHPKVSFLIIGFIKETWNLSIFGNINNFEDLAYASCYAAALIVALHLMTVVIFRKRDIIN